MRERFFLMRALVTIISAGIVIGTIDLAYCRSRGATCDQQSAAVAAAVSGASGLIVGILTKAPEAGP